MTAFPIWGVLHVSTDDIIIVILIHWQCIIHLHGVSYTNVYHDILQRSVIFLKWVTIEQFIPASPAVKFILFYRQNFTSSFSNVGLGIDKSISFLNIQIKTCTGPNIFW